MRKGEKKEGRTKKSLGKRDLGRGPRSGKRRADLGGLMRFLCLGDRIELAST